jgi:hypothetical protein
MTPTMKNTFAILVTVVILCLPAMAGQAPTGSAAGTQERVAALKQALAANQAALKQYTWTETTEISLKGEVKKRQQKACRYGADGKVVKTETGGEQPQQQAQEGRGGGRRRGAAVAKKAVVAHKVGDIKDYMEQVAALVHQYVPPDKEKIQAAQSAGHVSVKPDAASGSASLAVQDYAKAGDALDIGLDLKANALSSYNVRSYLEDPKDDLVTLAVRFDRLPDGTSYPQQVVLDASAKNIQVKVTNSGYTKSQ